MDALKEFYADRDARQQQFEDLKAVAEEDASSGKPLSMEAFAEDWNESQFWVRGGDFLIMRFDADEKSSIRMRLPRFLRKSC